MVWCEEMILNFGRMRHERWARGAGMALCLLVLVFSFAAKLSWYQPKSLGMPVKSLSSSKMWQHEAKAAAAMMAAPEDSGFAATQVAAIVSAVLLLVVAVRWGLESLAADGWLERDVAVALRQTQFARISQLRAPPVR
jgi:hypothetical protein